MNDLFWAIIIVVLMFLLLGALEMLHPIQHAIPPQKTFVAPIDNPDCYYISLDGKVRFTCRKQ